MKIAFFTYPSAFQNVGGGEILLLKVREYLQRAGETVDLFDTWKMRVEDYQILQVFGSVKDCLGLVEVAKSRSVKVVTTPLLWSDWRRALFNDQPLKARADYALRYAAKLALPALPSARRKLLLASDALFPNSQMEKRQVARHFAIPANRMHVVYNGVDADFQNADPSLFRSLHGDKPFVLGVGRIEPRKNQLNLIRACRKAGVDKLVLIGSPVSGYESYFSACRQVGQGFTVFIPTLPHADPVLKSAYAACSLFVLQGWFETPGLVALEAALAGAKVVATKGGSTREYFRDFVNYLNPSDVSDMARCIRAALHAGRDERLRKHVLENFTWDKIAHSYQTHYRALLKE